jgi:hypothetical protein
MGTTTLHRRAPLISRPLLTGLRMACCGLSWCWQGEQSITHSPRDTARGAASLISVFISYAHRDEKLKDRFLVHLGALKRERLIGIWHDQMLRPGEHLEKAIERRNLSKGAVPKFLPVQHDLREYITSCSAGF